MKGKHDVILLSVVLSAVALVLLQPMLADATHFWTHRKWIKASTQTTTNAGPYCLGSSLGNMNIGFRNAELAFNTAAGSINGLPAKYSIGPRIDWVSSCQSRIAAGTMSNPDTLAIAGLLVHPDNNFRIVGEQITMNKNIPWTNSGCVDDRTPIRASYVFRHELAHGVEYFHGYDPRSGKSPSWDPTSAIFPGYKCTAWDNFSSHDSASLSSIYGS